VKTAILRLDQHAIRKLDPVAPHPMALRDIMSDAAMYHATVLPLKGLRIEGKNNYDAVREIIFQSLRDESLGGEPYNTLKGLAYELWEGREQASPSFQCPYCLQDTEGLSFGSDEGKCIKCGGHLFLSDMIGFHLEMDENSAPESVSTEYMTVHEVLLLFTGIRYFWERKKYIVLKNALFLKDGPLTLRGQYSKLVIPIRNFFQFAKKQEVTIHVAGQEKTGAFVNHLEFIARDAPDKSYIVPDNDYIRQEIQHRPQEGKNRLATPV